MITILGLICTIFLFKEYNKTNLLFSKKTKFIHFLTTIFIITFHFNSFRGISNLLYHPTQLYVSLTDDYPKILGIINVINYVLFLFASAILTILGAGLIQRMEIVRKVIVKNIVIMIPLSTIAAFMYGVKNDKAYSGLYLIGGCLLSILVYGSISYILNRKFMIEFFKEN